MPFDYKKEYKAFYLPKNQPVLVDIPPMNYIAVRGQGDPNQPDGEYQDAMRQLYGIAFTIKMSKMGDHRIEGYFDYVVPPLEGLWWQEGGAPLDLAHKEGFRWVSMIRLPDFVTPADFAWAVAEATAKKKADFSGVEFLTLHEGLCVQCMHVGAYDDEPATLTRMHAYLAEMGYTADITDQRRHHEIYLSDARKVAADKRRTVLRQPIRQA